MTNKLQGTLYVGVTNNLIRRVYEHKNEIVRGFTKKYKLKTLVYFECYDDINFAIQKEKNIKHYSRLWKTDLINKVNPQWLDLYKDLI